MEKKEKIQADLVILGNLICERRLTGGGKIYPCRREQLESFFDIGGACIIEGDVCVDNFHTGGRCVVVCGGVSAKGGGNGQQ